MGLHLDHPLQQGEHLLGGPLAQLQADNGLVGPPFEELGHQQAEIVLTVLKFFRVKGEVRVPGGADDAGLLHLVFSKEGRGPLTEDGLQAEKAAPGAGQEKQRGQRGGKGDKAQGGLAAFAPQQGGDIQRLVVQMGGGMALAHDLGRENGEDHRVKVVLHLGPLLLGQLVIGQVHNALLGQQTADPVIELALDLYEAGNGLIDRLQLFPGTHAALAVHLLRGDRRHVHQAAHPDHEELV